jgi:hypothetical protein
MKEFSLLLYFPQPGAVYRLSILVSIHLSGRTSVVENYVKNIERMELAQKPMSEGLKGAKNRADRRSKIPGFFVSIISR